MQISSSGLVSVSFCFLLSSPKGKILCTRERRGDRLSIVRGITITNPCRWKGEVTSTENEGASGEAVLIVRG